MLCSKKRGQILCFFFAIEWMETLAEDCRKLSKHESLAREGFCSLRNIHFFCHAWLFYETIYVIRRPLFFVHSLISCSSTALVSTEDVTFSDSVPKVRDVFCFAFILLHCFYQKRCVFRSRLNILIFRSILNWKYSCWMENSLWYFLRFTLCLVLHVYYMYELPLKNENLTSIGFYHIIG